MPHKYVYLADVLCARGGPAQHAGVPGRASPLRVEPAQRPHDDFVQHIRKPKIAPVRRRSQPVFAVGH
jgi:hypothetical protein